MAWRLVLVLPFWLAKGVVDRVSDAVTDRMFGPDEPFEYESRTQPDTITG